MTSLIITKTGETKNMIDFEELTTGIGRTVMKTDFLKAIDLLELWQKDVYADNFTSQLFRLFCKADDINKIKLFKAFPAEMSVYLLWYRSREQKEFFNEWRQVHIWSNDTEYDERENKNE